MMEWAKIFVELIDIIAWPAVVIAGLLLFRSAINKGIANLLARLSSFESGSTKITFSEILKAAENQFSATETINDKVRIYKSDAPEKDDFTPNNYSGFDSIKFIEIAESSPDAAILTAWTEVERKLQLIAIKNGLEVSARLTGSRLIKDLRDRDILSRTLFNLIMSLQQVRNFSAHASAEEKQNSPEEAKRFILLTENVYLQLDAM